MEGAAGLPPRTCLRDTAPAPAQVPGEGTLGPPGHDHLLTLCLCPSLETPRSPGRPRERPALGRAQPYSPRPVPRSGAPPRAPADRSAPAAQPRPEEISLFPQQTSGGEDGRGVLPRRPGGEGAPASASGRLPRPPAGPRSGRRRPGEPRCGTRRGARRGRGSPFWPLSAAYQESERKAHRQKSSSVRKVPLRSLISSGARRAPAGPRPHGPGSRGRGAGGREAVGGPRPRGGMGLGARGRAGARAGGAGDTGRALR